MFTPHWSAKIEYQYIDLGSDKLTIAPGTGYTAAATLDAEHAYNTIRAGVNYHFGTVYEPLK
ncbi:MAG: outer membrane protein [Rhodomicrobium sp.]